MPKTPPEPKRITSITELWEPIQGRVEAVLEAMKRRGFDAVIFESRRRLERQRWLYGVGRTHHKQRRPVTWTLDSRHIPGKAVDIISKSRLRSWPEFYDALAEEGRNQGLDPLPAGLERCHLQWEG